MNPRISPGSGGSPPWGFSWIPGPKRSDHHVAHGNGGAHLDHLGLAGFTSPWGSMGCVESRKTVILPSKNMIIHDNEKPMKGGIFVMLALRLERLAGECQFFEDIENSSKSRIGIGRYNTPVYGNVK